MLEKDVLKRVHGQMKKMFEAVRDMILNVVFAVQCNTSSKPTATLLAENFHATMSVRNRDVRVKAAASGNMAGTDGNGRSSRWTRP